MIETELGTLRRSHYSNEITSSMDGNSVTVMGWVLTIRGHGNITFATIRDQNGPISIIAKKGDCPDEIREKNPERLVKDAVWGMLPHGRLGRQIFRKLKVYPGTEHPHEAQQPEKVDFFG